MRMLATAFLLAGCATAPSSGPASDRSRDQFIVRDGSSTKALAVPDSPAAYTPPGGVAGPGPGGGGLSKVCTPQQNGIGADCRAL